MAPKTTSPAGSRLPMRPRRDVLRGVAARLSTALCVAIICRTIEATVSSFDSVTDTCVPKLHAEAGCRLA